VFGSIPDATAWVTQQLAGASSPCGAADELTAAVQAADALPFPE
jgi:hypothetical protein